MGTRRARIEVQELEAPVVDVEILDVDEAEAVEEEEDLIIPDRTIFRTAITTVIPLESHPVVPVTITTNVTAEIRVTEVAGIPTETVVTSTEDPLTKQSQETKERKREENSTKGFYFFS